MLPSPSDTEDGLEGQVEFRKRLRDKICVLMKETCKLPSATVEWSGPSMTENQGRLSLWKDRCRLRTHVSCAQCLILLIQSWIPSWYTYHPNSWSPVTSASPSCSGCSEEAAFTPSLLPWLRPILLVPSELLQSLPSLGFNSVPLWNCGCCRNSTKSWCGEPGYFSSQRRSQLILKPIDDIIDNSFIPAIAEGHSAIISRWKETFLSPSQTGWNGNPHLHSRNMHWIPEYICLNTKQGFP